MVGRFGCVLVSRLFELCRPNPIRALLPLCAGLWAFVWLGSIGVGHAANGRVPQELRARATSGGLVRVIVQLAEQTVPEPRLGGRGEVAAQRGRIEAARRRLLLGLRGTRHRVTARPRRVPALALDASLETLDALERLSGVVSVHEDRLSRPSLIQSAPLVEADLATVSGFDGSGWAVAILDTGVDSAHPFLAGRIVEEACFSGTGDCPQGSTSQFGAGSAAPCTYSPGACSHGTHVAGIAAGRDAVRFGVASGADIIAIQVFSRFSGSICGGGGSCPLAYTSDLILASEHVLDLAEIRPVASVNLSLGGSSYATPQACDQESPAYRLVVEELRAAGIATVAASGNSGFLDRINWPACVSSAISVGSTTKFDQISGFSNSAFFLSLLAPGSSISSSVPGGGFGFKSGTSMSTPHVTGAWAVLKQSSPLASVDVVLEALQSRGLPITDINGVTTSRIRVFEALDGIGEVRITGRRLVIRNRVPENESQNRIQFVSRSPHVSIGPRGSESDPRCGFGEGGSLTIFSTDTGKVFSQDLPCENWTRTGAYQRAGYRYLDPELDQGPCKVVTIRNRMLRVTCVGRGPSDLAYDLEIGEAQAPVGVHVTIGSVTTYCAEFGGEIRRDGADGEAFVARRAPAPAACTDPPTP